MGAIITPSALRCALSDIEVMKAATEVEIACHPEGGLCISCDDSSVMCNVGHKHDHVDMMAIWTTSPHCCWNSTVERKRAGNTTGSCYYVVEGLYPYQPRCSCALQRRASSVSSTKSTMTQSLLFLLTVSFIHWRLSILVIVFPCNRCVMWNNDDNSIGIMIV